jgi:predicted transposase YdaD
MLGGDSGGIIEQWKRLALEEPDERKRSDYGALALIFAEPPKRLAIWQRALEGWNMQQSTVIREWIEQGIREGRQEGRQEGLDHGAAIVRSKLLHYLQRQFGDVPNTLRLRIESQRDLDVLDRWFDQALNAASLDQFQARLPPPGNGAAQ